MLWHLATAEPDDIVRRRLMEGGNLATLTKNGSEDYLMEASGPTMDAIEEICRAEGIDYEEFTRRAIDAFLAKGGEDEPDPEDEADQDETDWWKGP